MVSQEDAQILIIEDSSFERNLVLNLLSSAGFSNVTAVAYGEEGIEKFERDRPDLVLLDLTLPTLQGVDVLKRLKKLNKINPDAKFIVVTSIGPQEMGIDNNPTLMEVKKFGVVDWILKSTLERRLIPSVKSNLV